MPLSILKPPSHLTAPGIAPHRIPTAYHPSMRLLEALATAFFRTFGITQPTDQALRRAVWFLFGLLALILFAIGTATIIVFHTM